MNLKKKYNGGTFLGQVKEEFNTSGRIPLSNYQINFFLSPHQRIVY